MSEPAPPVVMSPPDSWAAADLDVLSHAQSSAMQLYMVALSTVDPFQQVSAWDTYFASARDLIQITEWYNARWDPFLRLSEVALPFVKALLMRADYAFAAADHARASAYRDEALELTSQYLDGLAAAGVRRGRAMDAAFQGRFHEALVDLEDVRSTFAEAGAQLEVALTVLQIATILEWLGDYERALVTINTVRRDTADRIAAGPSTSQGVFDAIARQLDEISRGTDTANEGEEALILRRITSEILEAEGRNRRRLGHYDAARSALEEARTYALEFGLGSAIDYHLAAVATSTGNPAEASQILQRIEPDFVGLMRPRLAALRLAQAEAELAGFRPKDALDSAQRGLNALDEYPDDDTAWRLELRAGRALRSLQRQTDAFDAYRRGAEIVDRLRRAPLGYRLDSTYVADKMPLFIEAVSLACEFNDGATAARLIEQAKSRALAATLSIPQTERLHRGPDERRFDEICATLDGLEFAEYRGADSLATRRERGRLAAEREELLERLRIAEPRWRALSEPASIDVEATLTRLTNRNRYALTLFRHDDTVTAVLLGGGRAQVARHRLTAQTAAAVEDYVQNLREPEPFPPLFDPSVALGLTVESIVPPAIVSALAGVRTLLVVPHGALHVLPWSALTIGGRRLFEGTAVGVLPNLSCFDLLDEEPLASPPAVLIGDPDYTGLQRYASLPHAGAELNEIAALYRDDLVVPVSRGEDADERTFWEIARRADVTGASLHVACHGTLDPDVPLQSGLLLTRSKVDAAEVARARLGFREVILSACSTGWRPQRVGPLDLAGDDALGLTAAFLEAGARFVLVSVPPAEDAAMRTFAVKWHRYRRDGRNPLEAFAATQRDLLSEGVHQPWSWTGITAYGCS